MNLDQYATQQFWNTKYLATLIGIHNVPIFEQKNAY